MSTPRVIITQAPTVRSTTRRVGESASHSRAVPAMMPHVPSLQKASTEKIIPKTSSWTVTLPLAGSTKCGNTAAKKTNDLGLRIPTVKPWRTTWAFEGRDASRCGHRPGVLVAMPHRLETEPEQVGAAGQLQRDRERLGVRQQRAEAERDHDREHQGAEAVAEHREDRDGPAPRDAASQGEQHARARHDDDRHRGDEERGQLAPADHARTLASPR